MTAPIIADATSSVSAPYARQFRNRAPQTFADRQRTQGPPSASQQQSQTATPPQAQQTFAEMQQRGLARPAPQQLAAPQQVGTYQPSEQQTGLGNQLTQSVTEALQRGGSRYALPEVQKVRDALQGQLQQQFGAQRKQIDEEMARRGIGASSIASGYYGDLAGQQSNAMANLDAQLIQDAARTNAGDLSSALASGQGVQSALANQGLAAFGLNLQGTQANNAANQAQAQFNEGQYNNAANLAMAGASGSENSRQFDLQQQLAQTLGLGNLGLQQQQLQQQGQQFDKTFGLSSEIQRGNMTLAQAQQSLNEKLQTGQLSLAQANQALAELQNKQQFGLQQQQLGENTRQFDVQQALAEKLGLGNLGLQEKQYGLSEKLGLGNLSLADAQQKLNEEVQRGGLTIDQARQALAEKQNEQQYGVQQAALTGQVQTGVDADGNPVYGRTEAGKQFDIQQALSEKLGLGNLGLQEKQLTQQGSQFDKSFGLQQSAQDIQKQQFADQLAQQLGIATMSDKTQNRQVDTQAKLAENELYLRIAQMLAGMGWPGGGASSNPAGHGPTDGDYNPAGGYTGGGATGTSGGAGGGPSYKPTGFTPKPEDSDFLAALTNALSYGY